MYHIALENIALMCPLFSFFLYVFASYSVQFAHTIAKLDAKIFFYYIFLRIILCTRF